MWAGLKGRVRPAGASSYLAHRTGSHTWQGRRVDAPDLAALQPASRAAQSGTSKTWRTVQRGRPEALYAASRRLLAMAGVHVRQHRLERPLLLRIGC